MEPNTRSVSSWATFPSWFSSSAALYINGIEDGIFTNTTVENVPVAGGYVDGINWEQFTVSFTAAGSSTVIGFYNASPPQSVVGLDDVSIATVPSVTSISAHTDNGKTDLNSGHLVTISLSLSEPVYVTGNPFLLLNDNEIATYTTGSGTNSLTFTYTAHGL